MFPIMPEALPGSDNFPVSFVIASTASQERILELARQIFLKAMQAHVFQFGDIDTKIDQPQAQIVFDHDKVSTMGLDMQKVGADLSASIGGNFVNRFNMDGLSYKVIPQIKRVDRLNPEQLQEYLRHRTERSASPTQHHRNDRAQNGRAFAQPHATT